MKKNKRQHKPTTTLNTPFGPLRLARNDINRVRKTIAQIQRTTDALTRRDIGDWRRAWQLAINNENPNRTPLYDIYRDVDIDLHLTGCIQQRQGFVLARSFKLVDGQGHENEEATELLNTEWFKNLMRLTLEANYWGHSLIEIDIPEKSAMLIPRKHVIPEYHRFVINQGDDWRKGIDYHQPPFRNALIEVGRPDDLGLYLKAATQTIPKKNALAFWDTFAEIFGMPMRIARTTSRDDKEYRRLEQMMRDAGYAGYMVAQQGTEIEIVESSKGDAYNVYDRRIDRANSELSKLIIGQTMTIEDGSSLSQSETHLKVFQNLVEADADMIRDMINNQLLPIMAKQGADVEGLTFNWDYAIDYSPEQQLAIEQTVLNNYDVDPEYFVEKYNIPARQSTKPTLQHNTRKNQNIPTNPNIPETERTLFTIPSSHLENTEQPFFA